MRRIVLAVLVLFVSGSTSGCQCERSDQLFCQSGAGEGINSVSFMLVDGDAQPYDGDDDDRILASLFDGSALTVSLGEVRDWVGDPGRIEWRQPNELFAYDHPKAAITKGRYDPATGQITGTFWIERTGQYWMFDRDLYRKQTGAEPLDPDRWVDTEQEWNGTISATVTRPDPPASEPTVDVVFTGENTWSARDTAGATAHTGSGTNPVQFVVRYRLTGWRE